MKRPIGNVSCRVGISFRNDGRPSISSTLSQSEWIQQPNNGGGGSMFSRRGEGGVGPDRGGWGRGATRGQRKRGFPGDSSSFKRRRDDSFQNWNWFFQSVMNKLLLLGWTFLLIQHNTDWWMIDLKTFWIMSVTNQYYFVIILREQVHKKLKKTN